MPQKKIPSKNNAIQTIAILAKSLLDNRNKTFISANVNIPPTIIRIAWIGILISKTIEPSKIIFPTNKRVTVPKLYQLTGDAFLFIAYSPL